MIKNPTMFVIGLSLLINGIVYMACALVWR